MNDEVHLVIVAGGTAVHVGAADGGDLLVDGEDLGVQHARLEARQAGAGVEQLLVDRLPGELHEPLVGVRTGHHDLHLHAPTERIVQGEEHTVIGREVGGGDAHPTLGELQQRQEQRADVGPLRIARGPDDLHHVLPYGAMAEAIGVRLHQVAAGLHPVVEERGSQTVDRRALHPEMGVAPFMVIAGVALPLRCDADAAGEPGRLVAHEDLAMGAVVDVPDVTGGHGPEPPHVAAGLLHRPDEGLVDVAGADRVPQHPHPDPCAGPSGQRGREPLCDVTGPIDEREEVDGVPRAVRWRRAWRGRSRRRCVGRRPGFPPVNGTPRMPSRRRRHRMVRSSLGFMRAVLRRTG